MVEQYGIPPRRLDNRKTHVYYLEPRLNIKGDAIVYARITACGLYVERARLGHKTNLVVSRQLHTIDCESCRRFLDTAYRDNGPGDYSLPFRYL